MFLISLGVFLVASGLGALANDGDAADRHRFIKGVSAGFTAPAGLSIITTSFAEGAARNKALSIYTATGATGFSLGLVFSGVLTEIGWRWCSLPGAARAAHAARGDPARPDDGRPARTTRASTSSGPSP